MPGYTTDDLAIDLARETTYRFLSAMFRHPSENLRELRSDIALAAFGAAIRILKEDSESDAWPLGYAELPPSELCFGEIEQWLNGPPDNLFAEYDRVFGIGPTADCPPYETEFCGNREPFYRAQQMADVAGFYKAFGLNIARSRPERPDCLALQLEFMSVLITKQRLAENFATKTGEEQGQICRAAQREFLRDHLVWWAPSYARGLERKAGDGPYAAAGRILASFLPIERRRFNLKSPKMAVKPQSIERPEESTGCNGCSTSVE